MTDRILIVDDDQQITSFLTRYLKKQDFDVVCVGTGRETLEIIANRQFDLCVLDIGLPDIDGFQVMRELRKTSNLPIIVLSVRDETYDRIFGLEFGADDYITKPFEPRELVARIRSVLRRTRLELLSRQSIEPGQSLIQFGPWVMNVSARTVVHHETSEDAGLTTTEFEILRTFLEQPRTVLTRDQLLDCARGPSVHIGDRAIDVHIMRLRKKIEPDAAQPRFVKTVHGVGYCFGDDVTRCLPTG